MATSQQAFDGDTLEAALARVAEVCGPRARITQAEKVRTGGLAGFFARERYEVLVEVGEPDPASATIPAGPSVAPSVEPMSLLELAEQVSDRERTVPQSSVEPMRSPSSTEGPTFQEVLRGIATHGGLPGGAAPSTAPSNSELFASLGIPPHLLRGPVSDTSVAQRLLAVLERTPSAPPVIARRGEVVAVIGEGDAARRAAGLLAGQVGQTGDDVVVAGPDERGFHTLHDVDAAQARVQLWRRCGVPFVVAICAPPGPCGTTWAREITETLAPVTIWGAVSAERKPEDILRWVEAIGGVDALAVANCQATATPAAVLATGIPVASVEGRRATPAAWTALLIERLTV